MITLEMCLDYIKNKTLTKTGKPIYPLTPAQERFLGNLCEGKITDTPRGFGKSFLINLYAECLNYYVDMVKYDSNIKKDDYISLTEMLEGYENNKIALISPENVLDNYKKYTEVTSREYNCDFGDIEYIKEKWLGERKKD